MEKRKSRSVITLSAWLGSAVLINWNLCVSRTKTEWMCGQMISQVFELFNISLVIWELLQHIDWKTTASYTSLISNNSEKTDRSSLKPPEEEKQANSHHLPTCLVVSVCYLLTTPLVLTTCDFVSNITAYQHIVYQLIGAWAYNTTHTPTSLYLWEVLAYTKGSVDDGSIWCPWGCIYIYISICI